MNDDPRAGSIGWKTIAGALGLGTVIVLLALMMLGGQASGILSTVGASVCSPCNGIGGQVAQPGDGGNESASNGSSGGSDGSDSGSGAGSGSGSGTSGGSGDGASTGTDVVLAVPRDNPLVIKTGTMSVQVADVSPAIERASEQISALGGYASGSKRSGTDHHLEASVTFRVPSEQWDAALNVLRASGTVITEETSTDDVTSKVVDLGARIRNLQVTEQALQTIMDKAGSIKDVLSVQDELSATRGEIEQLTAEKAHLEEQASYSTLTATFLVEPEPAVVVAKSSGFDPAKEVDAASAKLIRGLQTVAKAGIWFAIVWLPVLLTIVIGLAIAFVITRRMQRAFAR